MTNRQSKPEIACVILAAGLGRRFGGPKMLHIMPNGQTMIEQTIEQYGTAFSELNIVVTDQDQGIKERLKIYSEKVKKLQPERQKKFRIVECNNSGKGMSSSLIAGVTATLDADGWLIGLGDMPYVASDTIAKLKNNLCQSNIVIPRFRQQPGNPVGFGCQFREELLALQGDKGGKSITQRYPNCVSYLDTQDQGVLYDLDTPGEVR